MNNNHAWLFTALIQASAIIVAMSVGYVMGYLDRKARRKREEQERERARRRTEKSRPWWPPEN